MSFRLDNQFRALNRINSYRDEILKKFDAQIKKNYPDIVMEFSALRGGSAEFSVRLPDSPYLLDKIEKLSVTY